jgi:protein CpxP
MKKILSICCLFIGLTAVANAQSNHQGITDPVEKAKALQKQLRLSDDQTSKIAVIYQESEQKFDKIKAADHGNTNKMLNDIGPLRTATIKKVKSVLNHTQTIKYDDLIKQSKGSNGNGWTDGWSSTASNN